MHTELELEYAGDSWPCEAREVYLAGMNPLFVERLNAAIKELTERSTWVYVTNAVVELGETSMNPFPIHSNQVVFQSAPP